MKTLLWGIALIILVGVGGLIYRNALERPVKPVGACTLDAKVCPDGSAVGRVAPACDFAACAAPNVAVAGLAFAVPAGFASTTMPDLSVVAAFANNGTASSSEIIVRQYALGTSSPSDVMRATALGDASGAPVSPSAFSGASIGNHTYSFVVLGRFEGTVHGAFYLTVGSSLYRFDAIDQGVPGWTDPRLDVSKLPAEVALRAMLLTLQTNQ